ncbi:golgin subfamily A member 4-like [Sesamum indicum]|uniref:Golgin subfamily A member 4-like n=1 Tax=Sesamum indicum TaxID=4182 RepID=A0A6I9U9Y0_SESIN|nr:golgin subfamily A member 4-like [Sesamum indicum]
MFKLQRQTNKASKPRERLDFKFSNFQALQVPKGWDRLVVSIISVETGKTLAKSGKAPVKNGYCQWTETLSESIYIPRDDSSKGYEESPVKLVVSAGSTRSSNLGEATINVAQYAGPRVSAAVSLPLKKCSYGTILQAKIQCLIPRLKISDEESKYSNSQEKDQSVDHRETERVTNGSDNSNGSSVGQSEDFTTTFPPPKSTSKEASQSASGRIQSSDSPEGSGGRENLSIKNALKSEEYSSNGRQDGDYYSVDNDSPLNQSSENSRLYLRGDLRNGGANRPSLTNFGSSRNLLEAAEDTIDELRAEAKMWERNARKLMIDLDMSRKEFSDLSKKQAELVVELSAACAEREGLKREVEHLKLELENLATTQASQENLLIQAESLMQIQKVLENETKYQKILNDNLGQQLRRSQESNIELVSVLHELEETIEQQRIEIENLSSLKLDFTDLENSIARNSEDNRALLLQLQQLQESEKKLQADVELLEEALRDKTNELEQEQKSNSEVLFRVEKDYEYKMSVKEEEIAMLKAALSGDVNGEHLEAMDDNKEDNADHITEIESLRKKVEELEKDCTELTDENLELLFKLKESNKTNIRKCSSSDSISSEHHTISRSDESEISDPKFLEEELKKKVTDEVQNAGSESSEHFTEILKQLDMSFNLLMKPWYGISSETCDDFVCDLTSENKGNKTTKMSAEHILGFLQELNKLLEMRITDSDEILKHHEIEIKERNVIITDAKKKMEDSYLEVQELEKSKAKSEEYNANLIKELDQKRSEIDFIESNLLSKEQETIFLVQRQRELEITLSGLQEENMQFQECISCLETQVRQLKDEKEFYLQETDDFRSVAMSVQDEIQKLKVEMDIQILDLTQKSEDIQKRWLGAQEECEYLKEENKTLQASTAILEEERVKLLNSNSELKRINQELQENCSSLAAQLSESKKSLSECTKKVEVLEDHLASMTNNFALRENSLKSKVDALIKENSEHKEKLLLEENLHQILSEKTIEFESLQKDVEHLHRQVSHGHKERERISREASTEVSRLIADKAELQASLQEVQSEAELTKNELEAALQESKFQVDDLKSQLAAAKQSHERLRADHERILKLLANYRKSEEKLKSEMNELELKLTISDYECQQLSKEMSILKVQLQNISGLQDEISILKSDLEGCRVNKDQLELALHTVSGDYEKLKAEKISFSEKISIFQDAMSEFEECKMKKLELEEKLLQMEQELTVKELLCIQNAELKDELTELKRANMQFQQKMYRLEEEKDECLKKAQVLEENLKLMEGANSHDFHDESPLAVSVDHKKKRQLPEGLDVKNKIRDQLESRTSAGQKNYAVASKKPAADGEVVARERYERTKSSLETELRDLRERYLEMSLKYAEVEAEREDLVMKLKATRGGKKWFSWNQQLPS